MKLTLFALTFLISSFAFSQEKIVWSDSYKVSFNDFQSRESEVNSDLSSYTLHSGSIIEVDLTMSNFEFMVKKDFNNRVKSILDQRLALLAAPDTLTAKKLVALAQYDFDLSELYARKIRKEFYEKKGTFSDVKLFQDIYEKYNRELVEKISIIFKATSTEENDVFLQNEHTKVLEEISRLSDFCFDCKVPKKKKNRKKG
ncbi:hypothetical protein [Roseivirga pacifica]|uniref:hypothetical protein n=1 Tax=Roseivirga pacifica TaxID=1267423 RepID=UPI003BAFC431